MNPHPTHKLKTIKVVKNYEILYCDNCSLYTTHPEIEKPCKRVPDLLAEVLRREALQGEYAVYKSGRWNSTRPLEDVANSLWNDLFARKIFVPTTF